MKQLYLQTAAEWRAWLAENHDRASEIWLVCYRKDTGKPTIDYESAVEEALCFGWIDSIIRKMDHERFARKFTPRKPESNWSPSNKKRVERLIASGRMTGFGLALVTAAKSKGRWDAPARPEISMEILPAFQEALEEHPGAKAFFEQLAPGYQKQYIAWVAVAKRPETREKRIRESIALLGKGEKLGMK